MTTVSIAGVSHGRAGASSHPLTMTIVLDLYSSKRYKHFEVADLTNREIFQRSAVHGDRRRGRGARSNESGRFETATREDSHDGWESDSDLPPFKTEIVVDATRSIITTNDSPDISFNQSINPYRGCEHGCVYCFARPTHCYLGHSAGLDFETKLYVKPNAAALLEAELSRSSYKVQTIAMGTNTDPYQPIEREHRITRAILEVLERFNHPVGIVTKSALVVRDIDILGRMAAKGLAKVALSVTTLDRDLARRMEPRASTPPKRLAAMRALANAGVPVGVMTAPIIPGLNDAEIEQILDAARLAGATEAGYVLLRLPLELKTLFREWLAEEAPNRAGRVLAIMQSMHGGRDYDATFGLRQKGSGPYATMIGARFRAAAKRLGFNEPRAVLRTDLFARPSVGGQLDLF